MKPGLFFLFLLFFFMVSGCAGKNTRLSRTDAEIFSEKVEKLRLDGIAAIEPTRLYFKDYRISKYKLGAAWSSDTRSKISLVLALDSKGGYDPAAVGLRSLDIEIENRSFSYAVEAPTYKDKINYAAFSSTIHTASENFVVIPYSVYKRMLQAKDCAIRIHTDTGVEEVQFSIERGSDNQPGAKFFFGIFDNTRNLVK